MSISALTQKPFLWIVEKLKPEEQTPVVDAILKQITPERTKQELEKIQNTIC